MIAQNIREWWQVSTERTIHDWADWALKAILVGVITVSVSYLRNVADHLSSLDVAVKEIQYELKSHSSVQGVVNQSLKEDIAAVTKRMDRMEKMCIKGGKL